MLEALCILESGRRIVNGAWSADDEQSIGTLLDDLDGFPASTENSTKSFLGLRVGGKLVTGQEDGRVTDRWHFGLEERRRYQWILAQH